MEAILHNLVDIFSYDPDAPMIFSSGTFWVLFLLFIPIYALVKPRRWQMIFFVITFSLYFYYKSSGFFFLMLTATSLLDWLISRAIAATDNRRLKVTGLVVSICTSLGILGYFKYANFFGASWSAIVGGNFQPWAIFLPVGISFYTFQSISYVVDVYKGRLKPTETWMEYLFFLSYFPGLVAGPIVRADYFIPQIKENRRATRDEVYTGLWLIILGVIKKAIIADYIAQYNDLIFSSPTGYSGFESLMGVVGYTMQIYCDFSGYSDMAIGISLIMGFKLMKNFDFPYKSKNLTEFWHRWHISLSTWLRDYLYIPLGGNRKGTLRTYLNNFLTMLLGGLWHGAGLKFIIWGGMHGVGLAVHKLCRPLLDRLPPWWIIKAAGWTLTILYVSLLWVFFRAESFTDSWLIISNIFCNFSVAHIVPFVETRYIWLIMMTVIIVAHALPGDWTERAGALFVRSPWIVKLLLFIVIVQLVIQFKGEDVAPFIYFQF